MRPMNRLALLASLLMFVAASSAHAIPHPNVERGFAADKVYAYSGIDSVNQMNGNAVLTIPISESYPVGGGFTYGLTLTYNSKVWDFERIDNNGASCWPYPTPGCDYTIQALPSRRSNAGMGFRLSPGELIHPADPTNESERWLYVAADGSERSFHPTLRPGQTQHSSCSPLPRDCTYSYSRDGTSLRLVAVSSTRREVHFPDGSVHTFDDYAPPTKSDDWRLSSMRDTFGNTVTVSYVNANRWDLVDPQGRVTKVRSAVIAGQRVVTSIEQTSFGGGQVATSFQYLSGAGGTPVLRGCTDTDPATSLDVNVPLLGSITLPDGSRYRMTYYEDAGGPAVNCRQGAIASLELPTLGKVEWTYQPYNIPVWGCKFREWARSTPGVATRRLRDAAGAVLGTWTYDTAYTVGIVDYGCSGFATTVGEELRNTVTDPNGNQVEHYFSIWSRAQASPNGFAFVEYGLPLSRASSSGGHYRSLRVVEGSTAERSTFVRYEMDSDPCYEVEECTDRNRRQAGSRVVFHDDGNRYTQEASSEWDGQGHYRRRVTSSNFPSSATRTERTEYFGVLPAPGQKWLLNLYGATEQTEGGVTAKQEVCFDGATGFLTHLRRLRSGTTRSSTDTLVRYRKDSAGNLVEELYHGGDTTPIATSACVTPADSAARYGITHTYQAGLRATSQYQAAGGGLMPFKTLERGIHAPTGRVAWSRDISGLQSNFTWDSMGRLSRVDSASGHDADLEYKYFNATSASQPARVTVTARPQAGGTALAEEEYLYDAFGRLTRRGERMPDGTWSYRTTAYDGLGQVLSVSEAHGGTPVFATQYLDYDAFGRARRVRPPDGAQHDVTYAFAGTRQVQRTVKVGTSRNASGVLIESPQTTTELYDHQGRLVSVTEPPGGLAATYGYDVGGRLASAVLKPTGASSPIQARSFVYDQRGFLASESHPEKGTVFYSQHDARGKAERKVDGTFELLYIYDKAERIARIEEPYAGATRLLKSWAYGTDNSGSNLVRGKVEKTNRFNYVSIDGFDYEVRVRETYAYSGRGGRASDRTTDVFIGGGFSNGFAQGWDYDELGSVTTLDYPRRTCVFCVPGPQPRTQSFTYARGRLVAVPGYTGTAPAGTAGVGITYHPTGLVHQVAHTNGMVEYIHPDPYGMARPGRVRAIGSPAPRWNSGNYAYDGAGNLVAMGVSEYLYDGVGRLTEAEFPTSQLGGGSQLLRTYTYDPFGNLQAIGGAGGRSTPTSQTTNRLTQATYDSSGNLTAWNGQSYVYDAFGMANDLSVGTEQWFHAYTADDERIWSYQWVGDDKNRWTLRDLDGKVLREFEYDRSDEAWTVERDYIHRGSTLLAAETPEGRRHFHPDHLGSPRLITDAGKNQVAWHTYYPFGEEATRYCQELWIRDVIRRPPVLPSRRVR